MDARSFHFTNDLLRGGVMRGVMHRVWLGGRRRFSVLHDDHGRSLRIRVEGCNVVHHGTDGGRRFQRGLHVDGEVRLIRLLRIIRDSELD